MKLKSRLESKDLLSESVTDMSLKIKVTGIKKVENALRGYSGLFKRVMQMAIEKERKSVYDKIVHLGLDGLIPNVAKPHPMCRCEMVITMRKQEKWNPLG